MIDISLIDEGPAARCPAQFNLAAHVLAGGLAHPDKPALEILHPDRAEIWSHGRLRRAVLGIGGALLDRGLKAGDILLLRIGNDVDFPLMFLGAISVGIVPVPTSAQLTAPEVAAMIDTLDPAAIALGKGVVSGVATPDADGTDIIGPREMAAMRDHAPADPDMGDPDRLAYIIYTSGTSGRPRAVMHAHRAIWARRMMWSGWYDLRADDRLLHAGAFNWTYTLGTGLCDPWAIGATALIPAEGVDRATLARLLADHRATIFAAAPGVYRQLLKHAPLPDMPALRHGLSAGEKLPARLRDAWRRETGRPIYEALGMSEVSTFISASPATPAPEGAIGRPQQGRRVAVLPEEVATDPRATAEPVPVNTPGILAISRDDPGLMLGYRGAPDETAARYRGEWFVTGDMVQMDENGFVTYLGRSDDMMNAGGYRVSPLEVESALATHPDIHAVAAAEVEVRPDVFVIAAFYESGHDLDDDDLARHCAERLARYKCPRIFRRLDHLPRGANNKIRRAALRALYGNMP